MHIDKQICQLSATGTPAYRLSSLIRGTKFYQSPAVERIVSIAAWRESQPVKQTCVSCSQECFQKYEMNKELAHWPLQLQTVDEQVNCMYPFCNRVHSEKQPTVKWRLYNHLSSGSFAQTESCLHCLTAYTTAQMFTFHQLEDISKNIKIMPAPKIKCNHFCVVNCFTR